MMKRLLLTAATTLVASLSYAQNPLSVHVLNLQDGEGTFDMCCGDIDC